MHKNRSHCLGFLESRQDVSNLRRIVTSMSKIYSSSNYIIIISVFVLIPGIFKYEALLSGLVNIVNVSVSNTMTNFKDLVGSLRDLFPGF
jgi:hypothetical protein